MTRSSAQNGPRSPDGRLGRAAAITSSGAKRYPKEIAKALKDAHRNLRCGSSDAASPSPELLESLEAVPTEALAATWLGHATVLLRVGGLWVLTDPVFSKRVGVNLGPLTLGPERLAEAPAGPEHLPPIDVILLSHAHFDHLDKPSLRRLVRRDTVVVTARNTRRLVPSGYGDVIEIDWDGELDLGPIRLHAMRPAHWGTRFVWDRHRGFNSYLIRAGSHRVLYAGDSAMTEVYKRVASDYGGCDLSVFGIGAYDPWITAHANPEQVWEMSRHAASRYVLPMHHSTFRLSNEPADEPLRRLREAAGVAASTIVAQEPGRVWILPPEGRV